MFAPSDRLFPRALLTLVPHAEFLATLITKLLPAPARHLRAPLRPLNSRPAPRTLLPIPLLHQRVELRRRLLHAVAPRMRRLPAPHTRRRPARHARHLKGPPLVRNPLARAEERRAPRFRAVHADVGRDRVFPALRVELLEEVGRELGLDFFRIEGLVAAAQREERLVRECGAGEARDALGAVDVLAASADALG